MGRSDGNWSFNLAWRDALSLKGKQRMYDGEQVHYNWIVSEWAHHGPFNIKSLTEESILAWASLSTAHFIGLPVGEFLHLVLLYFALCFVNVFV